MKTLALLVVCLMSTQGTFGQLDLINGSFESYSVATNNTDTLPTQWTMSQFGGRLSSNAKSGSKAAVVWNWYYYGKGILFNGKGDVATGKNAGTPINFKPTALTGQFKYLPGNVFSVGDSGNVSVCLVRYNAQLSRRDTVGRGTLKFGPTNAYQYFQVPIAYSSNALPDTVIARFESSEKGFCASSSDGNCLYLYVDDLKLTNPTTGITATLTLTPPLLYPTPCQDKLIIDASGSIQSPFFIFSAQGKMVHAAHFTSAERFEIQVSDWPSGIYYLRDSEGKVAAKFIKE